MHYRPFSYETHPKIRQTLGRYLVDFMTQRTTRSIRYFDDEIAWVIALPTLTKSYSSKLSDDEFNLDAVEALRSLRFALNGLEQADSLDVPQSQRELPSQFEVTKAFRYFNQSYGGRRFVALCRDLVDVNMDKSLQPYMYEDLINSIYTAFNKNAGKDVEGLILGLLDMCEGCDFTEDTKRNLISNLGSRSSNNAYSFMAEECLKRPSLRQAMASIIVEGLIPSQRTPRIAYPIVPAETLFRLEEKDLIAIMKNLPLGMRDFVFSLLTQAPEAMRLSLIKAYLDNPDKDVTLIGKLEYFQLLPQDIKKLVFRGDIFSRNSKNKDVIHYFECCETEQDRQEIVRFCAENGRNELALALQGKPFSMRYFTCADIESLLPHINLNDPEIGKAFADFLIREDHSIQHERLLRLLKDPIQKDAAEAIVKNGNYMYEVTRLYLIDTFHLFPSTYKEWKYHA